ncbi:MULTISPECIES: hypothetical protein [Streptomyces]|uniref:hypothetical protein n=1 Tax=Streptomyces TaxID=1883 RepID=UPI001E334F85|nr:MULTISPECIES: hypothetical protein [Streptomyces]
MAYVKDRVRRDGSVYYTAMWRAGGTAGGKQESEVFDEEPAAQRFEDLVNGHGQNWPPGWIRGQGFVAERRRAETMFEPFALAYIDRLTGIQAIHIHTKHGLLSAIMQSAVDPETSLRASDPCAKTRLPRLDSTEDEEEIVFLEREEWAWIHECLRDDAKELGETIAETGFRWGRRPRSSPRDLRRRNGRPAIRVQRAWKKDEDGKSVLGPPKTRKSRRTVVIASDGREAAGPRPVPPNE